MIYFEADTENELQIVLDELDIVMGYPNSTGSTQKYGNIHPYKTKEGKPLAACFEQHGSFFTNHGLNEITWNDVDVPPNSLDELTP